MNVGYLDFGAFCKKPHYSIEIYLKTKSIYLIFLDLQKSSLNPSLSYNFAYAFIPFRKISNAFGV